MLTRRFAFAPPCEASVPISDEWLNSILHFGVKEGKQFTLLNPLFTQSALSNMPFFTI